MISNMDKPFSSFAPHEEILRYRSPNTYHDMLMIISRHTRAEKNELLKKCLAFSIQIDGSADRQMTDNKFVSARAVMESGEV